MKKLLSIIVLGLMLCGNAYSKNITIKCVDEKRDAQLILNFDEGGDWLMFNGRTKDVAGRKETVFGEQRIIVEITKDKIKYMSMIYSADTFMQIIINRFDGSMYQYGKIDGGERYDHNYMCEKSDRKF
ncbi:hypothetical protein [Candidatus Pelagibacter bacterium nBUS_25]|uniref:hypothetical protein n=1 Tax=Candidatus Pelagibacter bacterium nBUS_25 TaxID=3374187 RepID=UPI003EB9042C